MPAVPNQSNQAAQTAQAEHGVTAPITTATATTAAPATDHRLPLAGRHIVVTRPAQQAGPLCAAIEAAGGVAVPFPVLAIHPVDDTVEAQLGHALESLCAGRYDLAIFVSPNAIIHTFAALQRRALQWPATLPVAVVGKGSERTLVEQGVSPTRIIAPSTRFDSEGLLALPALQDMAGKQVIIFRGDGGRELTTLTLRARGATVSHVTCYRRSAPGTAPLNVLRQLWQAGQLDAITMTSSEGLRHLHNLLDDADRPLLERTPLFAPHLRIAESARQLGCLAVIETGAGDPGLLQGLAAYFAGAAAHDPRPKGTD